MMYPTTKSILYLLLFLTPFLLTPSTCTLGVDFSIRAYSGQYPCLVQTNYTFMIFDAATFTGTFNDNVTNNLIESKKGGIKPVDLGIQVLACKNQNRSVENFVGEVMKGLEGYGDSYSEIWLEIGAYTNPSCDWGYNYTENCEYTQKLMAELRKYANGKKLGIKSSIYDWVRIYGKNDACPRFVDMPLWYQSENGAANFGDFRGFAGWQKPVMKTYRSTSMLCLILKCYQNYRE